MSITSLGFIVFSALCVLFYYLLPKCLCPYTLLVFSLGFYCFGGIGALSYLACCTLVTFFGAILIHGSESKKTRKLYVGICCFLCFGLLFVFKYLNSAIDLFSLSLPKTDLLVPLGLSFYIFQSIGYVIDVYRKKVTPTKNIAKYLLFVSFFPQLIQGPIGRYDKLSSQLYGKFDFDCDNLICGIILMLWGYFKKLVVADRASVFVSRVFDENLSFGGAVTLFAVILYCIQLYCDFSGGIDIVRGLSKTMGITLGENFNRPIFADSLADFWRRWHISLGSWMRDYVFFPISLSKPFVKAGKFLRRHLKGKAGKILPVSAATFIVYFIIGIWHGGNFKYIVFGAWNGIIITSALLLEGFFVKFRSLLKISDKNAAYKVLKIVRTNIIVIAGRYITRASAVNVAVTMFLKIFTDFNARGLFSSDFFEFGLSLSDYLIISAGVLAIFFVELYMEISKKDICLWICQTPMRVYLSVFVLTCAVTLFGIYRGDYISSEFIYRQF